MPAGPLRNLITGGAGFLGSHLVDRLMQSGEEVICLDNYFTGRKDNISAWIGHSRFELIRHDVTEPIKLEVDRIWHLACPASPIPPDALTKGESDLSTLTELMRFIPAANLGGFPAISFPIIPSFLNVVSCNFPKNLVLFYPLNMK